LEINHFVVVEANRLKYRYSYKTEKNLESRRPFIPETPLQNNYVNPYLRYPRGTPGRRSSGVARQLLDDDVLGSSTVTAFSI
jgi:hypothetical protein